MSNDLLMKGWNRHCRMIGKKNEGLEPTLSNDRLKNEGLEPTLLNDRLKYDRLEPTLSNDQ